MAGAVDLSALKARAEAPVPPPPAASGVPVTAAGVPTPQGGPLVERVDERTFEERVLVRSTRVLVVVAFGAAWSEQSAAMDATLAALANESGGRWALALVDVEAAPRIAQAIGVQSVPTVVAIAGGQPVHAFAGPQPAEQVARWLEQILAKVGPELPGDGAVEPEPESDPRLDEAARLLDEGDLDAAKAAYEQILAAEPGNEEAAAAVRNLVFFQRAQTHPTDVVSRADAAPADVELGLAAADLEVAVQRVAEGFDRLVDLVRRTSGDERSAVRSRLLELFELFERDDPRVVAARRKLTAALF